MKGGGAAERKKSRQVVNGYAEEGSTSVRLQRPSTKARSQGGDRRKPIALADRHVLWGWSRGFRICPVCPGKTAHPPQQTNNDGLCLSAVMVSASRP